MEIFWRLILAHLLADFTFQTDFIAKWKRESIFGGLIHSLIFFICGATLCFGELNQPWLMLGKSFNINGWVALAVLSLFHFLEDEWRVWTIKRFNSADSFLFFLLDQLVHIGLIAAFFPPQIVMRPEKWVFLAILFVLVTHFASIFVYFVEKAVTGFSKLDPKEKYYSMAERLAVSLALILPGFWALSFAAAWIPRFYIKRCCPEYDASPVNIITGNLLAVLFGIIARVIYYG